MTSNDRGGQAPDNDKTADKAEADHEASQNQVRDEPVPASHHDERRPEAVERNEELSQGRAQARPSPPGQPGSDRP